MGAGIKMLQSNPLKWIALGPDHEPPLRQSVHLSVFYTLHCVWTRPDKWYKRFKRVIHLSSIHSGRFDGTPKFNPNVAGRCAWFYCKLYDVGNSAEIQINLAPFTRKDKKCSRQNERKAVAGWKLSYGLASGGRATANHVHAAAFQHSATWTTDATATVARQPLPGNRQNVTHAADSISTPGGRFISRRERRLELSSDTGSLAWDRDSVQNAK